MGPANSPICQRNLDILTQICNYLGVPLALEKMEGPLTTLPFLGILLDTVKMEARLPEEKLHKLRQEVAEWTDRTNARKREILSLVRSLQHATKLLWCGRAFVSHMYATAAKLQELHFSTRLNVEFWSDLCWWHTFLTDWNGLSLLRWDDRLPTIWSKPMGSWGCGTFWNGQWLQWQWLSEWAQHNKMVKELAPIVLDCAVWGKALAGTRVLF